MQCLLLATFLAVACPVSNAQSIRITLKDSSLGALRIDSANWNEAWIELDGSPIDVKKLDTTDIIVRDREAARRFYLSIPFA